MNITLTLTKEEMERAVRSHYALPSHTIVVIQEKSPAEFILEQFRQEGFLTESNDIVPHYKIASIKKLREIVGNCSLSMAKRAIEDFNAFILYVHANGVPDMRGISSETPWIKPS